MLHRAHGNLWVHHYEQSFQIHVVISPFVNMNIQLYSIFCFILIFMAYYLFNQSTVFLYIMLFLWVLEKGNYNLIPVFNQEKPSLMHSWQQLYPEGLGCWATIVMTVDTFLEMYSMGQLLLCHAGVLVPQKTKSTLKNLRISALGNRKWFFNFQGKKNCLQI